MKISTRETRILSDDSTEQEISYCTHCSKSNIKSRLGPRLDNYSLSDKDEWRQCTVCQRIQRIIHAKFEGRLVGVVDPVKEIDTSANIVGTGNKKLINDPKARERQRLLDKANKESDPEIRQEILKGNTIVEE